MREPRERELRERAKIERAERERAKRDLSFRLRALGRLAFLDLLTEPKIITNY